MLAGWATHAFWPAQSLDIGAALALIGAVFHCFDKVHIDVISMAQAPKKRKKRPKDMTTDEAMRHLFIRKGHKVITKHIAELGKKSTTKD